MRGALIFALLLLLLIIAAWGDNRPPEPEYDPEPYLIVDEPEATPACGSAPRLQNPCNRINCNRPDTRRVA